MKLQIAALVLLTAVSFATSGQTVRASTLTSTEAELQTAIASQDCSNCDSNSLTRANAKQFRPGRESQLKQRQDIRRQQEQRLQRNTQLRDQQIQRQETLRRQQERDYPQPEAIDRQQQEDARREWEEERDRQRQEDRDRRQQEELRREWEEDRDDYYDSGDYYNPDDDRYDDYDDDHYDDDYDNDSGDWRGDRYERPDRRDWYQNSEDDWHSQEQERLEHQRQEAVIRRNQERQTVWRNWENQQNVLRWHWDTWQRTYRPSLVSTTSLEITSLDNNWSTVSIEGIDMAQEVSFTGSGVQTVYLSPGAYRIRFSPVLSEDSWHSGYLVVGRTNRLRIIFDQNNESVQVLDDPQAWTVGDRLPGYPGN